MDDAKNESLTAIIQEKLIDPVHGKIKSLSIITEELKSENRKLKIILIIVFLITIINAIIIAFKLGGC